MPVVGEKEVRMKAGTRPSRLAWVQARSALDRIEELIGNVRFGLQPIASGGDTDRLTDLRVSPPDFFTRELDAAVLNGTVDLAIHSAKDLPDLLPEGIDWFWLPWREEPRDALVLPPGRTLADLPEQPVVGISSDRRALYCSTRFPAAVQKAIRGHIEERIAQLDQGGLDLVIMAAAALHRLNMPHRITEFIPLEQLPVPEGQGSLAMTFRARDERMMTLRSLFMPAVTFAGAGVGHRELCTLATLNALKRCETCLHDSLMDQSLLDILPACAKVIDVGKRCGTHSKQQHETTRLLCAYARQGKRVVRLKGGDPGIFGRLAEETEALEKLGIPFRVIPGISALQAATTGTGMLLTRRDLSRGFVALTPRADGGKIKPCSAEVKSRLPVVYYMAIRAMEPVARELVAEGHAPETPAAIIYNAGGIDEQIIPTTIGELPGHGRDCCISRPGLILVGQNTAFRYHRPSGAFGDRRILLTCSAALQPEAIDLVRDYGGFPLFFPLINLLRHEHFEYDCSTYDWIVVSSPSAVRIFMELTNTRKIDLRTLPLIMACGCGTAAKFAEHGVWVDAQPETDFSTESLARLAAGILGPNDRVLRLRSDRAGTRLAESLRTTGARVDDAIIYETHPIHYDELPCFDIVFFASASAVDVFVGQWGTPALHEKEIIAIGRPTAAALERHGILSCIVAREATVQSAIETLAAQAASAALQRAASYDANRSQHRSVHCGNPR